jgi:hypothetical protein
MDLPIGHITECCRLATLIYSSKADGSDTSLEHLQALKIGLQKTELGEDWLRFPGALLWCLIVGTCWAKSNKPLYSWFVSQLLRFWAPICLHRWDGLQRYLRLVGCVINIRSR